MWTNNINKKRYIGSSENLRTRFLQYFNINHLIRDNCMQICRALLKHGYPNFSLEILEYCEVSDLLIREKHYWDILNPEYNIAKEPGAPMSGRQHSDKSKKIMSDVKKINNPGRFKPGENHPMFGKTGENHPMFGKTLSNETKTKISDTAKQSENSGRFKTGQPRIEGAGRPSQAIEVTDITNDTTTSYDSIREAARALDIRSSSIDMYFQNNQKKPYKGQYIFNKK